MVIALKKQGEYKKALAMYEKALAIRLKTLGPDHAVIRRTYKNMAFVLRQQGEHMKALAMNEKALAIEVSTSPRWVFNSKKIQMQQITLSVAARSSLLTGPPTTVLSESSATTL